MDLTANQQVPQLIEPPLHNRRRTLAIVVILIVIISLTISIFTQPYFNPKDNSADIVQTQQGGDITSGLVWIGQIAISFIALLSSIAELTVVSIRDFFGLRTAKTNVEDFPFFVFQDYDKLLDYLFPDPKTPLLPDREIKYFPQVSDEADKAFQRKGMVLIRGKSKTGKTREACEKLRRWWYSGPTVLVIRSHVGLYPPFKIPENLPLKNLVLFFDDIDRYLGDLSALKRLDDTLQYFQDICHDRGELRVIATARQEEEFWKKLRYDQSEVPWNKFELIQVDPLSSEKAVEIIAELSKTSGIFVEPELVKILAEKNNGTFLNLVLAFRSWLSQKIKTVTSTEVKAFEGSLLDTWRYRYEEIAKLRSGVKPIYAAINLLQANNITLYPSLISEIATEMGLKKWILSTLGVMDRIQNWLIMSPMFNWYRDSKRRFIGWIAILVTGIFLLYLFLYAFLFFIPVGTLLDFFEQLSSSLQIQLICLSPLWIFVILFGVYFLLHILRRIVFRRTNKHLEFLLTTEIPLRSNELRPYENQVEGNGSTINWPISSYDGKDPGNKLPSNASHRLANRYLLLAEQFRFNGEFSPAKKFASLAQTISNYNPAPLFMLGRIELDDGKLQPAIQFLKSSETLYGKSCNKSYAQERLALCHLLTGDYESAEKIASEALTGISDLVSARWVLGLAQLKQGNTISGKENCKKALRNPIPGEIQEALVKTSLDRESWLTNKNSTILTPKKNQGSRWHVVKNFLAPVFSFLVITVLFFSITNYVRLGFDQEESQSRLGFSNLLVRIFPKAPILYINRATDYLGLDEYEKAIADYTEAIRLSPEPTNYNSRGNVYLDLGEYEKALADYNEATLIDAEYLHAYYNRALIYERRGEIENAIAEYNEAISHDPEYVSAYARLGELYHNRGDFEQAIANYTEAIRFNSFYEENCFNDSHCKAIINLYSNPKDAHGYQIRAHAYVIVGEYEKALADYDQVLRIDPKNSQAYYSRASLHQRFGEYDKSILDLTEVIQLNSKDNTAYVQRGLAYTQLGEYEKAVEDLNKALDIVPSAYAYLIRGIVYYTLGENDKATIDYTEAVRLEPLYGSQCSIIPCYTAVINLNPDDANAYKNRGDFYHRINSSEKAVLDYIAAIRLDPKFADSCINPSHCKAIIDFYSEPRDAIGFKNRGNAYLLSGEYEKAIADFTEATQLDSEFAPAYYYRGKSYYLINEHEKAVADYTKAIQLDTQFASQCFDVACYTTMINLNANDIKALMNRGSAYYYLGKYDLAMKDWDEAFRIASKASDQPALSTLQDYLQYWIRNEAEVGHVDRALQWLSNIEQSDMSANASTLNSVCWFGSLWGHAPQVLGTCEQAVLLEPNNADIRDSRGLARTLAGDIEGAILDFQYFVDNSLDNASVGKRKLWISELQNGNNPFTPQVLEFLK